MLLINPSTLALQKVVIIIFQPEPCIANSWCFALKTSAHMTGNQWYHVAWHYMQIPAMVDVMASCSSAPWVVI